MADELEDSPYKVVRRLAVGGMGEVLLARTQGDTRIGLSSGLVVVKRTIPSHPNRDHQDRMLKEEGRLGLRLRHANLVETFALDEVARAPMLVMEYLAGRSMAQVLGAAKRSQVLLPVDVALTIARLSACGLHFAHTLHDGKRAKGLVHRDVSPANIFVTFDGNVKVIDFGVAKADDSEIKTSTGVLKGKIGYMSPEHTRGERLDPRADLWSLGVFLWESLVADRLFSTQNPAQALHRINHAPIEPPSKFRPEVPADVDALVLALLARDKSARVSSGKELVERIDGLRSVRWDRADIGKYLCSRFREDADRGVEEARSAAKVKGEPLPFGLVSGAPAVETDNDAATVVANRRDLIRLARMAAGKPADDDDDARTIQMHSGFATDDDEPVTDAGGARRRAHHIGLDSEVSTEGGRATLTNPDSRERTADLKPSSGREQPAPSSKAGGSGTATNTGSAAQSDGRTKATARSSPVPAAFLTFGVLAIAMGAMFAWLATQKPVDEVYVAALDKDGHETLSALIDAPEDRATRRVTLDDPRFRVGKDQPFVTVEKGALEDVISARGVLARARLPQTPRARFAAALPPGILLLGLLALAIAVPAFVARGVMLGVIRLLLVGALAAAGFVGAESGVLTWPGLLALGGDAVVIDARDLVPDATPETKKPRPKNGRGK